jgi:hypothetical protein
VKRWLWLLIAACLPIPALSQTIDRQQDLSEAYARFFDQVWSLIELDEGMQKQMQVMARDRLLRHCCPNEPTIPPDLRRHVTDNWLAERLFSSRDIARIEDAVSQWNTDRQLGNALQKAPDAVPDFSNRVEHRYARIALDSGTKLGSRLEDRKHFEDMIRDCAHRLRFAPEYDGSRCLRHRSPGLHEVVL